MENTRADILDGALDILNRGTQDPRLREHIAGAVAKAINGAVAAHLRATGTPTGPLANLTSTGLLYLGALPAPDAARARAWFETLQPEAGRFTAAAVLAAPHLVELAADRNLVGLVREFLGAPPTLVRAEARWSDGVDWASAFSRDKIGFKSCTLRINLTEASPDGADQYLRGSTDVDDLLRRFAQDIAPVERLLADTVPEDAALPALQDKLTPLAGAPGAVFLFNPFGLHRGGSASPRCLAVEFTFALAPASGTELACRDVAALTARLGGEPLAHYAFRLAGGADASGTRQAISQIAAPAVRIAPERNPYLVQSNRGQTISVVRDPFLTKDSKVFAIGSCFALEIRKALTERGFDVYPKYDAIPFDPATQGLAKLPERDNVNHYNTFSIRQEFELAFGGARYKPEDFWQVANGFTRIQTRPLIQAPHRKQIYAASREGAADLNRKLDSCIAEGIHNADVLIVTLGLIEVWFNKADGLAVATPPGDAQAGGISALADFHLSTFEENYANIKRITELVLAHYPDKQLVFTVSPVVLGTTFTRNDIIVANCESKTILRAAAGKLMREYPPDKYPNIRYWPSYEIALAHDILEDGGSHVKAEGVRMIMDAFLAAHLK